MLTAGGSKFTITKYSELLYISVRKRLKGDNTAFSNLMKFSTYLYFDLFFFFILLRSKNHELKIIIIRNRIYKYMYKMSFVHRDAFPGTKRNGIREVYLKLETSSARKFEMRAPKVIQKT